MKINLGSKTILAKVPKLLYIHDKPYILNKDSIGNPILFSALCPHQHNVVDDLNTDVLHCPSHDWTFDPHTGQSINTPQSCLEKFHISIEDDFIIAELPSELQKTKEKISGEQIIPKITVVGSSALLIEWNSFNLLCDPWIEGTAAHGSWINYPPSGIKINDLPKIDAILISHEHTDHLHEYSLSKFDKDIPIYVSDFGYKRLSKVLKKLGFNNITSLQSGIPKNLTDKIQITNFVAESVWYDSIFYIKLDNFTILNVNDAGFNWSIRNYIDSVDMLCIQFSPASGFPSTWNHLDDEKKLQLMKTRNLGMLKAIKQINNLTKPKYILPFANFNSLYLPEHVKYLKFQPKNTPKDVVDFFKDDDVQVLEIYPGESWNGGDVILNKQKNHDKFYNKDFQFNYLTSSKLFEENKKFTPDKFDLSFKDIKEYFESFSNSQITKGIGKYNLQIKTNDSQIDVIVKFDNGLVSCQKNDNSGIVNMSIKCPGVILQEVIKNDFSWDGLQAGYWAENNRDSDTYNLSLWRFFHAPWRARINYAENNNSLLTSIDDKTTIADIIETGGSSASQIFEKFGLFCTGCEGSLGENIEDGCKLHGLTKEQTNTLIDELSQKFLKKKNT